MDNDGACFTSFDDILYIVRWSSSRPEIRLEAKPEVEKIHSEIETFKAHT